MFITRRVLIIIGAAVVVAVGLTVFAFIFFLSQAHQTAASSPTPTPTLTAPTKAAQHPCATGTVASINSSASSFVVTKGAKSVTITVDGTTTFRSHGKQVTVSSLAVGDQVRVVAQGTCAKTAQTFAAQVVMIVPKTVSPALTPTASPTP
ncbi:MAG TPA: DUF5666 domain-containing protein [Ktedonobacteraceae bacterium]|nr:DUF5666 domain-containing protein [Ktedonobacteraceae bacterium]